MFNHNIRDKTACFQLKDRLCKLNLQHEVFCFKLCCTRHKHPKNSMVASNNYLI